MTTATLDRKTVMPESAIRSILRACGIPPQEDKQWIDLVVYGVAPSFDGIRRGNRGKAFNALLDALSARYFKSRGIAFPPGWFVKKPRRAA